MGYVHGRVPRSDAVSLKRSRRGIPREGLDNFSSKASVRDRARLCVFLSWHPRGLDSDGRKTIEPPGAPGGGVRKTIDGVHGCGPERILSDGGRVALGGGLTVFLSRGPRPLAWLGRKTLTGGYRDGGAWKKNVHRRWPPWVQVVGIRRSLVIGPVGPGRNVSLAIVCSGEARAFCCHGRLSLSEAMEGRRAPPFGPPPQTRP